MDLDFSPDIDVIYCYLIALIIGIGSALQQAYSRFGAGSCGR